MLLLTKLVLLSCAVSVCAEDESLMKTYKRLVRNVLLRRESEFANATAAEPSQPLLVIGAGLGRTSTSSFTKALARLGLKSYHMDEVMEHPEHLELWAEHARQRDDPPDPATTIDRIVGLLARDGYNATADFPSILLHKEFLERYPEARVVLTVRSGASPGTSWARSVNTTLLALTRSMGRIPWAWTPTIARFEVMASWMFPAVGIPLRAPEETPSRFWRFPPVEELEEVYHNWNKRVIASVPKDKLLVFAASDGYEALCPFLAPVSPVVERNCQDVLAAEEPYPRGNSTAFMTGIYYFMTAVSVLFEWGWVALLAMVIVKLKRSGKGKQD